MSTAANVARATLFNVTEPVERLVGHFLEPRLAGPDGELGPALTILHGLQRGVIIGDFGAGKSTLLQFFAHRCATDFLTGKKDARCPIWLPAPAIREGRWTFDGLPDHDNAIKRLLSTQRCILVVDAIDEAADPQRTASRLVALLRRWPQLDVLVATRPATSPPELAALPGYSLQQFDDQAIKLLVHRLADGNPARAQRFLDFMYVQYDARDLMSRPLLLSMAWEVTRGGEFMPSSPEALFEDYYYERLSEIPGSTLTIAQRGDILGELAAMLYAQGVVEMPIHEWRDRLSKEHETLPTETVIDDLSKASFIRAGEGQIGFAHKSFQMFAIAFHLWRVPDRLFDLLDVGGRDRREILRHAAWLCDDVAPLVHRCFSRDWLIEAANCVGRSRAENGPLTDYVAQQLLGELGTDFFHRLSNLATDQRPAFAEAIIALPEPEAARPAAEARLDEPHAQLLTLLDACLDPDEPNHVRGRKFEEFADALFSHGFDVISRNRLTSFGEFDLSLEINRVTPFWLEWGGDAFVECKNRKGPADVPDINGFSNKVDLTRLKLAFFVSMSGFTPPALDLMKRMSLIDRKALLVPISGESVRRMLERREPIDDFFKRAMRDIRDQRK